MEDERIVELYLERNESAIAETNEKYGVRLRNLSLGITQDAPTAEECENDTYLKAWSLIPPHEPKEYLYAFLARITRHLSIDRCRERARLKRSSALTELSRELETCLPASDDVEDTAAAKEMGNAISRYLRALPKEKRVIFVRRYFYLDSIGMIAKRLGVTESKVKSSLFRTRSGLREYLIREGYQL